MSTPESAMTATELHLLRASYGLSLSDLAQYLDVSERTIRRWESGGFDVPAGVAEQVRGLDETVDNIASAIRTDFDSAQECGLWSVDMPLSAADLPDWARAEIPLSLWNAGAARAHQLYGVRLTSPRDLPAIFRLPGGDQ